MKEEIEIQQRNFAYIMEIILEAMDDKDSITLEEVIHFCKKTNKKIY